MGRHPDRRRKVAERTQPESYPPKGDVLAREVDLIGGREQQAHRLEPLLEAPDRTAVGHAQRAEVQRLPGSDAEDEPPARDVVEGHGGLGECGRVAPDHVGHPDAKAQPIRRAGAGSDEGKRIHPDVWAGLLGGLRYEVRSPHRRREPVQQVVRPPDGVEALFLTSSDRG